MMETQSPTPTQEQKVPSPTSTGGGGDQFEQHVASYALGLLLVRAIPPILTDNGVVEVHFQIKHMGWRTDDILVVGERSGGSRRKLALQVKRSFTVSEKNEECRATLQGMWDDFWTEDQFDPSSDQLAITVLHGTSTLLQDFGSLLHCARAATNAEDFHHRLSTEGGQCIGASERGQSELGRSSRPVLIMSQLLPRTISKAKFKH